jgi:drug/metabolite transporter (DMT)-like permease
MRAHWLTYAALAAGVLIVSTASILIRWAQIEGVPSIAIAAWRLTIAALVLAPLVVLRAGGELRTLGAADWKLAFASGVFLALHFASWILSLQYTSVASSVALVTTNPIWIALFSVLVLRERMPALRVAAVALALAGSGVILWADSGVVAGVAASTASGPSTVGATGAASNATFGNLLAVAGSLTVCGYLLIGQRLRKSMSLLAYIGIVYSGAALCLLAAAALSGAALWGYTTTAWLCLVGMALGPQLLGHSVFNYALKHVTPTTIALAVLGEPIGSAALAWLMFGEAIGMIKLAGMTLLLGGIFLAAKSEET